MAPKKQAPQRARLVGRLPVDADGNLILGTARGASAMAALFNAAELRCAICNALQGKCDCWVKCSVSGCAWSYEKGTSCGNPEHPKKRAKKGKVA